MIPKHIYDCMTSLGLMMMTIWACTKHFSKDSSSSSSLWSSCAFASSEMTQIWSATTRILLLIRGRSWSRQYSRMICCWTFSKSTRPFRSKKTSKAEVKLKILFLLWYWVASSWRLRSSTTCHQKSQHFWQMASSKGSSTVWRTVEFRLHQTCFTTWRPSCTCWPLILKQPACWRKATSSKSCAWSARSPSDTTGLWLLGGEMTIAQSRCCKMSRIQMLS